MSTPINDMRADGVRADGIRFTGFRGAGMAATGMRAVPGWRALVAWSIFLAGSAVLSVSPIGGPSLAYADTAPPAGQPATVSSDALPTAQIDGVAWSQVVVDGVVYVGGSFTTARPAQAAPGVDTVPRHEPDVLRRQHRRDDGVGTRT